MEITAQGENHRLLRAARQRRLVDAMGGEVVAAARRATAAAVAQWRAAEEAERRAGALAARDREQLERAREVTAELGPLRLTSGEDTALGAECARLRGAARLRAAADAMGTACAGGDEGSAADLVAAAVAAGRPVAGATGDAELGAVVDDAEELVERLTDLGRRARRLAAQCEVDDRRLAAVEERLDVLERVRRRHGGSVEAALSRLGEAEALVEAAGGDGSAERLAAALEAGRAQAATAAAALSRARRAAAATLERAVTAELRRLRLPHARFRVVLGRTPDEAGLELDGARVACGPTGSTASSSGSAPIATRSRCPSTRASPGASSPASAWRSAPSSPTPTTARPWCSTRSTPASAATPPPGSARSSPPSPRAGRCW